MIHPLHEIDHVGYAVTGVDGTVIVEPPLDIAATAVPGPVLAFVELTVPDDRVSGVRGLGDVDTHSGAEVWWAGGVAHAITPKDGNVIADLLRVVVVLDRPVVMTVDSDDNGADLFIGSLDRDPASSGVRTELASRYPTATFHASLGPHTADELRALEPRASFGLNAEAVRLTNLGDADMVWADPRFGEPASAIGRADLEHRMSGRWRPTVVIVRSEVHPSAASGTSRALTDRWADFDAITIRAEALASSIGSLAGLRDLVVVADESALAEAAARFLVRIGLTATAWLKD